MDDERLWSTRCRIARKFCCTLAFSCVFLRTGGLAGHRMNWGGGQCAGGWCPGGKLFLVPTCVFVRFLAEGVAGGQFRFPIDYFHMKRWWDRGPFSQRTEMGLLMFVVRWWRTMLLHCGRVYHTLHKPNDGGSDRTFLCPGDAMHHCRVHSVETQHAAPLFFILLSS